MPNHIKPTQEELDANAAKALEEAEALKVKEAEEAKKKQEEEDKKSADDESSEEDEGGEGEEGGEDDEKDKKKEDDVDYKTKFRESSRESQVLHAKNKKINDAVEKAKSLPDPTEEELIAEYPDWELLTDTEKKLAKNTLISNRRFALLEGVTVESKDIEAWNNKVDTFIEDPKTLIDHPELEGKQEDFKIFVSKDTRRGVDFEDLIPAFLYGMSKAKKSNKGKMFEDGTGGDTKKPKPKSDKISIDQARQLRQTNYAKYKEYLTAGKIEPESF